MSTSPPVPRLKKMVEMVLDENPSYRGVQARNSDIALTIIIWQKWYSVGTNDDSVVHLYRLFDLPREDNVKRVRAVFQNTEHKYLPTNLEVLKKRGIEREYWEDALGYKLTPDERATHYQTVKDTTPPPVAPEPKQTQKISGVYIGRAYNANTYERGKQYDLTVERLVVGKPVNVLHPHIRYYRDIKAFSADWRPV